MTVIVIAHAECNDGITAAWVVKQRYPDAEFYFARYGDSIPNVQDKDVIIVDFSYPREILFQMLESCRSMVLLDHHKSAKEHLDGLKHPKLTLTFDMERSGAGIAWDCFFGGKRPIIVDRVEDNDLWRFKYEDTRAFVEALRAFPLSVQSVDMIHRMITSNVMQLDAFIAMGRNIRAFKDELVVQAVSQAHEVEIGGYKVWAANVPYFLSSDVAGRLIRDRAFGMTYYQDDKERWHISLRSDDTKLDVAKFAEQFGGGGHRNAAGITTEHLPWDA